MRQVTATPALALIAALSLGMCGPAQGVELPLRPAGADHDILIADFEAADYGDWKVEGAAFGTAPARQPRFAPIPSTSILESWKTRS